MHLAFIEDTKLHGGTQLWVMDAIRFFRTQGWKITVISPKNGWIAKEILTSTLKVTLVTYDYTGIISQTNEFLNYWGTALSDADIAVCTVHPPRNKFHCSLFAAKCIRKLNLRTILVTKAGTIVPSYERQFYLPDHLPNSKVLAITKTILTYLKSNYQIPAEKILFFYQGIDIKYFKTKERTDESSLAVRLRNFKPIIGCIGSFEERKGQKNLIKAIGILKKKLPNIHLLLVGDGPDEKMLIQMINDMKLQSHITLVPFTRNPQSILQICDIIVLPSISKEGLPNVILEGFAMNIPVIASNIGGIPELIENGKTGFLVKPGVINELVNAIVKVWQDQTSYFTISNQVREFVIKYHDREKQFFILKRIFKELISK